MGLKQDHYSFILTNTNILDIGGGPSSMLLKCPNLQRGRIVDPIHYPEWTLDRYHSMNIEVKHQKGEESEESGWDEVWIYNCLQHTEDPKELIRRAKLSARVLRIFEWVNIPPHDGHPIELTKEYLDDCIQISGSETCQLSEQGCYGTAYYGVFYL